MIYKCTLILFFSTLPLGCVSNTLHNCSSQDWHFRGLLAGSNGETSKEALSTYFKECGSTTGYNPDMEKFEAGYSEGLEALCNPQQAFEFGKQGKTYLGTCPKDKESTFLSSYKSGLKEFCKTNEAKVCADEL